MKKILLISYYWPPAGGGGVQRWLKMSKYLADAGYDLTVYTPENGESPVEDSSLLKEVHPNIKTLKTPIWEPYSFYKKFTGKKSDQKVYSGFINDKKESFSQKASVFIRGNFFIPDARKFWIKPSVAFLTTYLKDHPFDIIISTGPPHSMHLIALGVIKKHKIPWIADFRDPWTNIDFYDQLRLTSFADKKHKRLEALVLKNASRVITVSESWAADFKKLSDRKDISVITNGFDPADFPGNVHPETGEFSICHIGSMNKDRNPGKLWEAIKSLISEGHLEKLKIRLIGQVDHQIFQSIEEAGLTNKLEHIPFKPHSEVVRDIAGSSVLLLPINDTPNSAGVIPGKLFEYMGAHRPILGIGPVTGDAAGIILLSGAGCMIDYNDEEAMKSRLLYWYSEFEKGTLKVNSAHVDTFSRKSLAMEYAKLIEELTMVG
ncbi:MAG: glycosyltransferase [Bacteroidetes bacterium]|nr:glycosyltransferase [Bacteroidota bacterium]